MPDETPPEVEFRSDVVVELIKHTASDADVLFAARVSTKGEQSLALEVGRTHASTVKLPLVDDTSVASLGTLTFALDVPLKFAALSPSEESAPVCASVTALA